MIILQCVLVVALGLWISRKMKVRAPHSSYLRKLTPTGILLLACLTLALLAMAALRQLVPNSAIGSSLGTFPGLLVGLALLWLVFVVVAALLHRSGRPISVPNERGDA
jgi:hypothetical protein